MKENQRGSCMSVAGVKEHSYYTSETDSRLKTKNNHPPPTSWHSFFLFTFHILPPRIPVYTSPVVQVVQNEQLIQKFS